MSKPPRFHHNAINIGPSVYAAATLHHHSNIHIHIHPGGKRKQHRNSSILATMKVAIVFVALCAVALAAPLDDSANAQIVRLDSDVQPDGYKFALETSDGKTHNEEGQLKNIGAEDETIVVRGSYSFVADDGQTYTVNYVADENGFQPEGAHLPNVGIGH